MEKTTTDNLFFEIHHCANLISRARHAAKPQKDPGKEQHRGQGRLLGLLLENDGIAQRDLVQLLDIRPSSASELVSKLEAAGYAERRYSENDRRAYNIFLTESGKQAAQQAQARRAEVLGKLFADLSGEEQAQLLALLQKLNGSLKEMAPDAPYSGHGHKHGMHGGHCRHGYPHHGPHHGREDWGKPEDPDQK